MSAGDEEIAKGDDALFTGKLLTKREECVAALAGALLTHLRYNARSDRLTRRDLFAVVLLLLAIGIYTTS